ncbi:MAG: prepilin peptidase [Candidatus Andersenbacteria bacterium]|nr:prepilin peptidase [Candidatus Andersenbacteria bacterium]
MLLSYVIIGLLFLFGIIIGSFLNVVILRGMKGEEIVRKPSYCPHCKEKLRWYGLIPIFSYLFLRGRCGACHQPISPQYPLVEAIAGLAAVGIFYTNSAPVGLLSFASICVLIVLAVVDLRTMLLPDKFILIVCATSISAAYLKNPAYPFSYALAAAGLGAGFLGIIWLVTRGQGIGLGDVKLMVPIGFLLGFGGTVTMLFLAFIIGGAVGIYLLVSKKASAKTAVPFGPFLAGAAIICLLFPSLTVKFFTYLGWGI